MPFVAIEGPTGVGKTTLATRLAECRESELLLDPYEANPFLSDYYARSPSAHWTPLLVEASFVFLRVAQLRAADLSQTACAIADYSFERSRVYAELLPDRKDARRLRSMLELWLEPAWCPSVVVLLKASVSTLVERVAARGRPFEQAIGEEHLRDLVRLYDRFPHEAAATTVIEIDTEAWHPDRADDLAMLVERLRREGF